MHQDWYYKFKVQGSRDTIIRASRERYSVALKKDF